MITPLHISVAITAIFVAVLVLKKLTNSPICAICAGVSLTWITLLISYWLDWFAVNPILIAVLMGQSVVGLYYLLERKLKERWHVFRLPFLLSGTLTVYLLLGYTNGLLAAVIFVATLWLLTGMLFLSHENPRLRKITESLIACCKNW